MTDVQSIFKSTGRDVLQARQDHSRYQTAPVDYLQDVLNCRLTRDLKAICRSVRDNPVTIARSANSVGKSQPVDTEVPTPVGFRRLEDLRVGDYVFSVDGQPAQIVAIHPQGIQPTYRVAFRDGASTEASEDHLWAVKSSHDRYHDRDFSLRRTSDLTNKATSIPQCQPVAFPSQALPIDPYLFGCLLGDGSFSEEYNLRFSNRDDYVLRQVGELSAQYGLYLSTSPQPVDYRLASSTGNNYLLSVLRKLGLNQVHSYQKFIPEPFLIGSVQQRKRLLGGLLDTDGGIAKDGRIYFSTTSVRLAQQVRLLTQSLGGVAHNYAFGRKSYSYRGQRRRGRKHYRVHLTLTFCPFYSPSKKARWQKYYVDRRDPIRFIKSIEPVGDRESLCIEIDHPSGLYLTEEFIVTHNTFLAARLSIWFYKVFRDSQVYTTAAPPLANLRRLLWGEIGNCIDNYPDVFSTDRRNVMHISGGPKHFITGVAIPITGTPEQREAKFAGKHAPHILFVVDEADAVPPEIFKGIESCMSGGMARLLCMFNPRAPAGPVYQMERDKRGHVVELSALDHPNVVEGEEAIPGAVTRETIVRRINEWTRPVQEGDKNVDVFEVPDFLVGCVAVSQDGKVTYPPLSDEPRVIVNPAFSYMVLGLYPKEGESQLISQSWLDAAVEKWYDMRPDGRPVLGFDVAEFGSDKNALCRRYGDYVGEIETWDGVDPHASAIRVAESYDELEASVCFVDGTGVGAGVAPQLTRDHSCYAISVKFASKPTDNLEWGEFYQIRDQLYWRLREFLKSGRVALPPDEELIEELRIPTYEKRRGKYIKVMSKDRMKKALGRSPDKMESLVLTFFPVGADLPEDSVEAKIDFTVRQLRDRKWRMDR